MPDYQALAVAASVVVYVVVSAEVSEAVSGVVCAAVLEDLAAISLTGIFTLITLALINKVLE